MFLTPTRSLLLGAFVLLAADSRTADELAFAPKADMVVKKSFTTSAEIAVDDMSVVMNGEEMDPAMMGLPADLAADGEMQLVVEDTYKSVEGDLITSLSRSFETVGGSYNTSMGEEDEATIDELEGRTVQFTWNAEDEAYEVSFDGDDELSEEEEQGLQMMDVDMDYRALLPADGVEAGAKWEVSGIEVLSILLPGANIADILDSDEVTGEMPDEVRAQIDAFVESSKATLTYAGSEDGVGVVNLAMTMEFDTSIDPSTLNPDAEMPGDMLFEIEFSLEVEGSLNWDLATGHFSSCNIEGTGSVVMDVEVSMEEMGMDIESFIQATIGLSHSGTAEIQ